MFNPLIKNITLQVPLSQVFYHRTGMSFEWEEVRLLIPYEQLPIKIDVDWKLMEEFKASFQGEIVICLQCHRIKQHIEITEVTIRPQDQRNSEEVLTRIKKIIKEITTISCKGSILPDKVRTIMKKHGFECDENKARRILSVILDPSKKRQIVHTIPLAQVDYQPGGVNFKWNDIRFSIPHKEFPVKLPLAALVEEFKSEFKGDMNATLVFEWLSAYIEVKEIRIEDQVLQGMNDVISRITKLVERIQSKAKQKSLNLTVSQSLFRQESFHYDDDKLHRILAVIFDPSEKRQIDHRIPLAQVCYQPGGISFKWNDVRFSIPHKEFPVKLPLAALVEEFKSEFTGDMNVTLVFEWLSPYIEVKDIRIEDQVLRGMNDVISRITKLVERIQAEAKQKSLNLAASRRLFGQKGFQYKDDKLQSILSLVINQMPVQRDSTEVSVPLSQLEYHAEGIGFLHAGVQLEVTKDKLPFEVGPALDDAKEHFEGEMIFQVDTGFMCAWEPGKEKIVIGYLGQEVSQCTVQPATLSKFKDLRGKIICAAIENLDKTVITIDQVAEILQGWGLDLKHWEIAGRIIRTIPSWPIRIKDFYVPLKEIDYHDDKIIVVSDGEELTIPASKFRFKTHRLLENIKDVFEGNIHIVIDKRYGFAWDEGKGGLHIEERNAETVTVDIDDDTLAQFERIRVLYIVLEDEVGPEVAREFLTPPPKKRKKVPPDFPVQDYDREHIRVLDEMAREVLITKKDLWFHIGACLVRERTKYGKATYIFRWPQERLESFIAKTWIKELKHIREKKEESGYVHFVRHTGVVNWKRNLERRIRENCCFDWSGASGESYRYYIYELPVNLKRGQDGNYIYAKLRGNQWRAIYIGEGELGDTTDIDNHHKSACLESKGATHVHVHMNPRQEDREAEEADLLAAHTEAYQPTGCNEKLGG